MSRSNQEYSNEIFNPNDFGFLLGICIFENNIIGIYCQYFHGLLPAVNYYHMDKYGNLDPTKDIRQSCLSFGLKLRIDEDIY